MPSPIKIRAQSKGDVAEIRVQMMHPMETGQRKEGTSDKPVPAHFIQTFGIAVNGRPVVEGQTGPSISRHPVFIVKVRGAKAGDRVTVNWLDNKGEKRSDEAAIV